MVLYGQRALTHVEGATAEDFAESKKLQDAVLHCLMIVGEAANHVSSERRQMFPDIPWASVIGFRHVIVHDYGRVQLTTVWSILTQHIPRLVSQIESYLSQFP